MKYRHAALAVAVFMAGQGLAVHTFVGTERLPAPPDLNRLPQSIEGWRGYADLPISAATAQQLGADRALERAYMRPGAGVSVDLFVAWFQSQRGGATQPHSPKVCLPGSGWLPIDASEIRLKTSLGEIPVERYVVANRGTRGLALYWYQTPRRVITGEWQAKFFTMLDGLRDRRTDTAIVRIFMTLPPGRSEPPEAAEFASAVYPELRRLLPR
jgi:EpsI family protein